MALARMDKLVKKLMSNPADDVGHSSMLASIKLKKNVIFLLENLSINVPYHRLTTAIVCLNFYSSNLSRFQYFDRKGNTHQR
jgi:hypothetical protein